MTAVREAPSCRRPTTNRLIAMAVEMTAMASTALHAGGDCGRRGGRPRAQRTATISTSATAALQRMTVVDASGSSPCVARLPPTM